MFWSKFMTATIAQLRKAVERIQCGERFNAGDEAVVSIVTENQNNSEAHSNIHWKSMDLLSRREHSYSELKKKLTRRFEGSEVVIESVLCELQEKNLQSDLRFTQAYIDMRKKKGFGPIRIRQELKEKGVTLDLIITELQHPNHDWFASLEIAWNKKFNGLKPESLQARYKQQRFLTYRGFTQDHICMLLS